VSAERVFADGGGVHILLASSASLPQSAPAQMELLPFHAPQLRVLVRSEECASKKELPPGHLAARHAQTRAGPTHTRTQHAF
jgi:hypothetical protein